MLFIHFLIFVTFCQVKASPARTSTDIPSGVAGGYPISITNASFQAFLSIDEEDDDRFCGGTIINRRWIITAAHCFMNPSKDKVVVGYGHSLLEEFEFETDAFIDVDSIIVHPDFVDFGNHSLNDVALVHVTQDLNVTQCVSLLKEGANIGEDLFITGFGKTSENMTKLSPLLQRAEVKLQKDSTCQSVLGEKYNSSIMVCAGVASGDRDACDGDSGGPLYQIEASDVFLIGVTSFGEGCAREGMYGVYTRLSSYSNWISNSIDEPIVEDESSYSFCTPTKTPLKMD